MKYLKTYEKIGLNNNSGEIFSYFTRTLKESIFTWEYFVDWKKIKSNIRQVEKELNLLNYLLGKENLEFEFINLLKEYPDLKIALPILIAIRKNKLGEMKIVTDAESLKYGEVFSMFYDLNKLDEKGLLNFLRRSGLKEIFTDKSIKNLVDYCYGIEVGLDTNARKNRTGVLMEKILETYIKEFYSKYKMEYISQATKEKILGKWSFGIEVDKYSRRFDFAIFNKTSNKLFLIETNYYSGGGSKLKSTAGEYIELSRILKQQGIVFIWITDGPGWKKSLNPLLEAFKNNDYVLNMELLNHGTLDELLLMN